MHHNLVYLDDLYLQSIRFKSFDPSLILTYFNHSYDEVYHIIQFDFPLNQRTNFSLPFYRLIFYFSFALNLIVLKFFEFSLLTGWWAQRFDTWSTGRARKSTNQSHKPPENIFATVWGKTWPSHVRTKSFIGRTARKPTNKSFQWKHLTKFHTQTNNTQTLQILLWVVLLFLTYKYIDLAVF